MQTNRYEIQKPQKEKKKKQDAWFYPETTQRLFDLVECMTFGLSVTFILQFHLHAQLASLNIVHGISKFGVNSSSVGICFELSGFDGLVVINGIE